MKQPTAYFSPQPEERSDSLVSRRGRVLGAPYKLFYDRPLHVVRAKGARVWDAAGREYIDAYNNVPVIGHADARVIEAVARQSARVIAHTRYLDEAVVSYAEDLLGHFPPVLNRLVYTCTGSESNDLAIQLARQATGNQGILVTENAYHGVTAATAGISPSLRRHRLSAEVVTIPSPLRSLDFAESVRSALADMAHRGLKPAALFIDTIFSSDGVADRVPGLGAAVTAVREAGGLVVADEVQAGFARLGRSFWGFRHHGFDPDVVTLGKPMGNGYPVAGVVASDELMSAFAVEHRYFSTFGGTSAAAAAAQATLDALRSDRLPERAEQIGRELRAAIASLVGEDHCRGSGLFVGVQLTSGRRAVAVINRMRELGVLVSVTGPANDVLKIRPPLCLDRGEAERIFHALEQSLRSQPTP